MEWFKHVVLVSSFQDFYSPYESARIELPRDMEKGEYCYHGCKRVGRGR